MEQENNKRKQVHEYRFCKEKSCNNKFYVSVAEKEYFEEKGMQLPKRCYPCRIKRREGGGSNDEQTES